MSRSWVQLPWEAQEVTQGSLGNPHTGGSQAEDSEEIISGSSSGVEHQLPKLRVVGSNPISRSKKKAVRTAFYDLA
jgi:hypothetical protein